MKGRKEWKDHFRARLIAAALAAATAAFMTFSASAAFTPVYADEMEAQTTAAEEKEAAPAAGAGIAAPEEAAPENTAAGQETAEETTTGSETPADASETPAEEAETSADGWETPAGEKETQEGNTDGTVISSTQMQAPAEDSELTGDPVEDPSSGEESTTPGSLDPSVWSSVQLQPIIIPAEKLTSAGVVPNDEQGRTAYVYLEICFHDPRTKDLSYAIDPTGYEVTDENGNILTTIYGDQIADDSHYTIYYPVNREGYYIINETRPLKEEFKKTKVILFADFTGVGSSDISVTENGDGYVDSLGVRWFIYCDENYPIVDYTYSADGSGPLIRANEPGWYLLDYGQVGYIDLNDSSNYTYSTGSTRVHVMQMLKGETIDSNGESHFEPETPVQPEQPVQQPEVKPVSQEEQQTSAEEKPAEEAAPAPAAPAAPAASVSDAPQTDDQNTSGWMFTLLAGIGAVVAAAFARRKSAEKNI